METGTTAEVRGVETSNKPKRLIEIAIQRSPSLFAAVLATVVFAIIKGNSHFSLLGDDFIYQSKQLFGALSLDDFNFFARRPVSTLITYFLFLNRVPETFQVQFLVAFFLEAYAFTFIVEFLYPPVFKRLGLSQILLLSIFMLYPCFHEVLFMNLTLAWSLGALFWALSLNQKNLFLQSVFVCLAAASLETYILPMALLPLVRFLINRWSGLPADESEHHFFKKRAASWALGVFAFLIVRTFLLRLFPDYGYAIDLNLGQIFAQAINSFKFLWTIHFYKTYWFSTVLQLMAFTWIGMSTYRARKTSTTSFLILVCLPFLTTIPMWLVAYYAPRSVHASVLMNLAVLASLGLIALQKLNGKKQALLLALLFLGYSSQIAVISKIKARNSAAIEKNKASVTEILKACPSICAVDLSVINSGYKSDWVLPSTSYQAFVDVIAAQAHYSGSIILTDDGPLAGGNL